MKLRADQLESRLAGGLSPLYVVSGDEPLLVQEACDAVRKAARSHGCSERVVFDADRSFDWNELLRAAGTLSLFSERRLIDLRLPGGRPGDAGARTLIEYCGRLSRDTVLLLTLPRADDQIRNSKWFKTLDAAGVIVQVWAPDAGELADWVAHRMQVFGLQPDREAVELVVERVEGNLLACIQEIEKIRLLGGPGPVDADRVIQTVTDSARFDVFDLVDSALAGDSARCVRIARGLEGEGVEPTLVLWALARAIRAHARFAAGIARGERLDNLLKQDRSWFRRQNLIHRALQRHGTRNWWRMLRRSARVDRIVKGQAAGNVRDELLQLSLMIAGDSPTRRPRSTG